MNGVGGIQLELEYIHTTPNEMIPVMFLFSLKLGLFPLKN